MEHLTLLISDRAPEKHKIVKLHARQEALRSQLIDHTHQSILLAQLLGSTQADDEYTNLNADGVGRVREYTSFNLHMENAHRPRRGVDAFRGILVPANGLRTQVFQVAGCDLRCWYCYVDFSLLKGDSARGVWLTARDMIDAALGGSQSPEVIELSGGQPELVPEWTLWIMQELDRRNLRGCIRIWSDDNLTSDFFWRYLSKGERSYIRDYPGYSRSVCLKGYDSRSFSANTSMPHDIFEVQIALLEALIADNIPLNIYLTMVDIVRPEEEVVDGMRALVRKLEVIRPGLSHQIVPLRMSSFQNMMARSNYARLQMFGLQQSRAETWRTCVASKGS